MDIIILNFNFSKLTISNYVNLMFITLKFIDFIFKPLRNKNDSLLLITLNATQKVVNCGNLS